MQRGQADGFSLDILGKLRDVKSKDNNITLLHYIVRAYMREQGKKKGEGQGVEGDDLKDELVLSLPVPEPSDVERASLINFDEVDGEVNKLKRELEACGVRVEKVMKAEGGKGDGEEGDLKVFREKMTGFLEKAGSLVQELQETFQETEKTFQGTLTYFEFSPKKREQATGEFFGLWVQFCNDFKTIWRNEQQRVLKERVKMAEKMVKQKRGSLLGFITKKPKQQGGLVSYRFYNWG